jgi:hypothetical protein
LPILQAYGLSNSTSDTASNLHAILQQLPDAEATLPYAPTNSRAVPSSNLLHCKSTSAASMQIALW